MIYLLGTDGRITYINNIAATQFDSSPHELVGKHISEIFPPAQANLNIEAFQSVINSKEPLHRESLQQFPKRSKWIEVRLSPVFDKNNSVVGVLGLSHDISERKMMETTIQFQLKFSNALNEITSVIISTDERETILQRTTNILGETLNVDRCLIYDVSFSTNTLAAFCEWLNPDYSDIISTKGTYPTDIFINGLTEMQKTRHYQVSHFDMINPALLNDGSAKILHEGMNIKSGLWYPFSFHLDGYFILVLNTTHNKREWAKEEIDFLNTVSKQVSIVLEKIRLLDEKHKSDKLLIEQSHILRTILDNSPIGLWMLNENGNMKFVNKTFCYAVNIPEEKFLTVPHYSELYDEVTARNCMQSDKEAFMQDTPHTSYEKVMFVDGQLHDLEIIKKKVLDEAGNLLGLIGISLDITERKRAEEAMSESEQKYRFLADNTSDTLALLDLDLNYTYISPSVFRQRGYTVEEAMAQRLENNTTPETVKRAFQLLKEELANEASGIADPNRSRSLELEQYCKDGTTIWVDASLSFIRDLSGKAIGVYAVSRDITGRKRAEEQIRKLSLSVEQSPVSIIITNPAGEIEYVNPKFSEITGYTKEEVFGKNPKFLKSGETEPKEYKKLWSSITQGKVWQGEFHNKKKNGELFWEAASISPVRDELGVVTHFIAIKEDITERKKTEEKLKESEEKFRLAISNAPFPIMIHAEDGEVLAISQGWTGISGYALSDIPNFEKWTELAYSSGKQKLPQDFNFLYGYQGRKDYGEYSIICKDGSERIWDFSIASIGKLIDGRWAFISMAKDVTERKRAEDAVKESEEKFRKLAETASDSIVTIDSLGRITSWNKSAEQTFGYSFDEVNGKDVQTILPQKYKSFHITSLAELALGREPKLLGKTIAVEAARKDKTIFPIEISLSSWEANNSTYYTAIIRDISERVKAEHELETYRNHLEVLVKARTVELNKANKSLQREIEKEKEFEMMLQQSLEKEKELSEMKSRFISTASHEFRTPLTSVFSSAELLQRYGKKWNEEKKDEHLERIKKSIEYLTKLLDDVLTISRTETKKISYQPVHLDLFKLAEECTQDAKSLMNDRHELKLNYKSQLKKFYLDAKLLRFVFSNLLSNAIKYSPNGGKVELKISTSKKYLIIEVSDEGIGIPTGEIERIFESFYRTKNSEEIAGTGLGLAIVKRAVDLHNGEIIVESEINKGTTFIVKIPKSVE